MIRESLLAATLFAAPVLAMAATCSAKNVERFVAFLPSFMDSKTFALQRTVLPLPLLTWQEGVDTEGRPLSGPQKSYLSASEYFRWPTLNQYMQSRELLSRISKQTASAAVIELYKEGSEGLVSFHFKTEGGCWKLWQYEVRGA